MKIAAKEDYCVHLVGDVTMTRIADILQRQVSFTDYKGELSGIWLEEEEVSKLTEHGIIVRKLP